MIIVVYDDDKLDELIRVGLTDVKFIFSTTHSNIMKLIKEVAALDEEEALLKKIEVPPGTVVGNPWRGKKLDAKHMFEKMSHKLEEE